MVESAGRRGGDAQNQSAKAELLYVIDNSDFYRNDVAQAKSFADERSVPVMDNALDNLLEESFAAGLRRLKGHRVAGGMRAYL